MFRLYREIDRGEFFVVAVDCAQGGLDANFGQFLSKTKIDVPLVFEKKCVAAEMTPIIHEALEWLYSTTGIEPVVAFERQMGGVSALSNLQILNRNGHYRIFQRRKLGTIEGEQLTDAIGWDTNVQTRPQMLGDLKQAIDNKLIRLYDKTTIDELGKFIINKRGRAEAAANCHDDAVMSLAIAWQLYQSEQAPSSSNLRVKQNEGTLNKIY
ncbi:MAG: hypothetical protein K6G49_02090 [Candidatus Saccharibacteria bacterium]|nr:hypothetical protein [Candidatus Saccharibacteria bacterium]